MASNCITYFQETLNKKERLLAADQPMFELLRADGFDFDHRIVLAMALRAGVSNFVVELDPGHFLGAAMAH